MEEQVCGNPSLTGVRVMIVSLPMLTGLLYQQTRAMADSEMLSRLLSEMGT